MKEFYIIAPLSPITARPRLFKLVSYLKSRGFEKINFICWDREVKGLSFPLPPIIVRSKFILKGGGLGGNRVKLMYLLWFIKVFFSCLKIPSGSIVWALGFESAFPALLASKFKKFDVIFDDADRFSMLFLMPKFIENIVAKLERYTSKNVSIHVIPGLTRYRFQSPKFFLLKNMPSKQSLIEAKSIFDNKKWPKNKLVINANGWLGETRGVKQLLELARRFQGKGLTIIAAGRLDCKYTEELVSMNNVVYLGHVSNQEALASYFCSDFVFTYYNPSSKVNCHAESNKWGDALKTGNGIIVNNEVLTADYLVATGAAVAFPYLAQNQLNNFVQKLIDNPDIIESYKNAAFKLSNKFGFFEEQLDGLFSEKIKMA